MAASAPTCRMSWSNARVALAHVEEPPMRYFKSKHGMEPLEPRQLFNADLIGTAFDVTNGQPLPGGEVSATFTVKNQNGFWFLDDAGTFKVYVYLSQDAAIGADDLLIGSTSFASLGAGQSITRTIPLA